MGGGKLSGRAPSPSRKDVCVLPSFKETMNLGPQGQWGRRKGTKVEAGLLFSGPTCPLAPTTLGTLWGVPSGGPVAAPHSFQGCPYSFPLTLSTSTYPPCPFSWLEPQKGLQKPCQKVMRLCFPFIRRLFQEACPVLPLPPLTRLGWPIASVPRLGWWRCCELGPVSAQLSSRPAPALGSTSFPRLPCGVTQPESAGRAAS